MKIALDAMGGDFAPLETVKGAVQALGDPHLSQVAKVEPFNAS